MSHLFRVLRVGWTVVPRRRAVCQEFSTVRFAADSKRLFERDEAVLDREFDQPGDIADMQLLHQAAAVGVHGFR